MVNKYLAMRMIALYHYTYCLFFIVGEYHLVEVQERARVRRGSEEHVKLTLKVADTFSLGEGKLGTVSGKV